MNIKNYVLINFKSFRNICGYAGDEWECYNGLQNFKKCKLELCPEWKNLKRREEKLKINSLAHRVDLNKLRIAMRDFSIENVPRATPEDFKKLKAVKAKIERFNQENKKIMKKYNFKEGVPNNE